MSDLERLEKNRDRLAASTPCPNDPEIPLWSTQPIGPEATKMATDGRTTEHRTGRRRLGPGRRGEVDLERG